MVKRLIAVLFIPVFLLSTLTGCWDRRELNELGIVMAIGIDRDKNTGDILVTSQVVRPSELKKQGGGGKEATYDLVTTSNKTLFEAIRDTVKKFDRRSIFSHVKVIVVGESLAKEGINDIIDFISRTHEIRTFTWLVIAKNCDAKDVMGVKRGIEKIQANYMEGIIKRESDNLDVSTINFIEFIKKMPGEGIQPVIGSFSLNEEYCVKEENKKPELNKILSMSGTAVFKKDKLVGYLDKDETIGFNLITKNKKNASVHVPSPGKKENNISIEIKKTDKKITAEIIDGKINFNIKVSAEGNITEVQDNIDVSNVKIFDKVNDELKGVIQTEVDKAVKKIQSEMKSDILGLGSAFQRKYPKEWSSVKEQWDDIFPTVVCNIEVETKLRRSGMIQRPVNAKRIE